ncbi:hypothetical protein GJ496_001292 [Pomphorhynchus laevis]|nr:hypothetical protein GJ496_001292 [Pomphorhynchus laevis]
MLKPHNEIKNYFCNREYKDQWIKWKYNAKRFIPSNCHSLEKEVLLKLVKFIEHRRNRSLYSIIYTYPNIKSVLGRSLEDGRHLTHIAAEVGDVVALQLLLWNGANPSATDSQGNTAMYYAKKSKKNCCENILATYGVNDERRPSTRTASYLSTTASEHNQRLSINLTALHPDSNQRKTIKSDSLKFSKKRMSRKK